MQYDGNSMKKIPVLFLQAVTVLIGIGALAFLLWEPQIEGRNVGATQFQIYFNDPFLIWAYTGSIAFFVAIYQTLKLLNYAKRGTVFSQAGVKALRTIRYSAFTIIGFIAIGEAYLFIAQPGDDIAGGVFMGLLIAFISSITAATAAMLEGVARDIR